MDTLAAIWEVVDLPLVIFLVINLLLVTASLLVYAERVVSAFIQERTGPNRVGPRGILQPFADVFKLLFKEDIVPTYGNGFIHSLAPTLMVVIAMSTAAVIPFAGTPEGGPLVIADISVGLLLVLAMTSITVYGVTLAGWSSNSKYSLLGGLRSSAQMISYELAMGAAALSVVLYAGSLSLFDIVESQNHLWQLLRLEPLPQPRRLHRLRRLRPRRDQPRAVRPAGGRAGARRRLPHGVLGDEVRDVLPRRVRQPVDREPRRLDALPRRLPHPSGQVFLVGVLGPGRRRCSSILQVLSLLAKTAFLAFCFIWIRWTLPRFKYNQLMTLGWKYLLPIAIANIFVIALLVAGYQLLFVG